MKKGDKVYCIKDFGFFEKYWSINESDMSDKDLIKIRKLGSYTTDYLYFVNGKSYVITDIYKKSYDGFDGYEIEGEIREVFLEEEVIVDDDLIRQGFRLNDDDWEICKTKVLEMYDIDIGPVFNSSFDEYFVSEKEFRRMKLSELSDINFSNFLKDIKE